MSSKYQHPGVYVQEVDGPSSIVGADTSTPLFIGVAVGHANNEPTLITSWQGFEATFGGLIWNRFLAAAVYTFFAEGGSNCYVKTLNPNKPAAQVKVGSLQATATSAGDWCDSWRIVIAEAAHPSDSAFSLAVQAPVVQDPGKQQEQLLLEYVRRNQLPLSEDNSHWELERFDIQLAQLATAIEAINRRSLFIQLTADPSPIKPKDGNYVLSAPAVSFDLSGLPALIEQMHEQTELAVLTDATSIASQPAEQRDFTQLLTDAAELHRNVFVVCDTPFGLDEKQAIAYREGLPLTSSEQPGNALASPFGAIYYPWISILNPITNRQLWLPPAGAVLGRYADTDQGYGVWKAPAGIDAGRLTIADALYSNIDESEQGPLNTENINAIRKFPNYGILIWGARTLSSDYDSQYVSVRRLLIYVEQSIKQSLGWVVFEPTGPKLWGQVQREIETFLNQLWQQGALFGTTAKEAYFVTVDQTNNTPSDQEQGILNVTIGIAAEHPAEFIVVAIKATTSGSWQVAIHT